MKRAHWIFAVLPALWPAAWAQPEETFGGALALTANTSLLDRALPSFNEKLTLDYRPADGHLLEVRIENYTESSYNENPPGVLGRNINEHKFEAQATYTYAIGEMFSVSAALLHHENFTFADTYAWGIASLTAGLPIVPDCLTLTANASAEKRLSGGRLFYDLSATIDYAVVMDWTLEASVHRYENFGQFDPEPTQKLEYEFSVIRQLAPHHTLALSFFRHIQFGAPNDQFSFARLKWSYSF